MGAKEEGDKQPFTEMSNWTPCARRPEFNQAPVPPIAIRVAQRVTEGGGERTLIPSRYARGAEGRGFGQWAVRTKCGERVARYLFICFFTYKYQNTTGRRNLEQNWTRRIFHRGSWVRVE